MATFNGINISDALITTISKQYKHLYGGKAWPSVKLFGPQPQAELVAAHGLQHAYKPRSHTGTAQILAVAMYLRADGASNGQVMQCMSLSQSKNNVLTELCGGYNGNHGAKYLTRSLEGGVYKATLTAKGEAALRAWLATNDVAAATPAKAAPAKRTSAPRKPKAAAPAAVEPTVEQVPAPQVEPVA